MTTVSLPTCTESPHIRKMDLTRDLNTVADLIELCFHIQLDQDGQDYIKEMRKAARDMRLVGWLSTLVEIGDTRASGFVWEENERIVGNLSLIPFRHSGVTFNMIANVAVHPEYRRRGIARALTKWALTVLRKSREPYVWLQVRDDNHAAHALYRSMGFVNQCTRTTWRIRPMEMTADEIADNPGLTMRRRQNGDWAFQQEWLRKSYPPLIRWNLPVNFRRFGPGILPNLVNFMDGELHRHWAFEYEDTLQGVITWQRTNRYANNLWLAFPEEREGEILPQALPLALQRVSRRHPLSIDYPVGRRAKIFSDIGFHAFRSLIWMRCRL